MHCVNIKLFNGNSLPSFSSRVARQLQVQLGQATVDRFSDDEINIEVTENVRGCETYIVQSTCQPTNNNLMELMLLADALRRASAESITAVIPYFGYARQDRRPRSSRVPISAKVIADMLASVGIKRMITVELHADQIQGFFNMPVDNVYASNMIIDDMKQRQYDDLMLVSPDVGGVVRARAIAKRMNDADLAIIDKRRPKQNQAQVMNIIGEVAGRDCVIVDDIVDTAGTLCKAAKALKDHGAKRVVAYGVHPVLSGDAVNSVDQSCIDELVVCDTVPLSQGAKDCQKIRQISLSSVVAETILRVSAKQSVSSLFPE